MPHTLLCPRKGADNPRRRPRPHPSLCWPCSSSTGSVWFPVHSGNSSLLGEMHGEASPEKGHEGSIRTFFGFNLCLDW